MKKLLFSVAVFLLVFVPTVSSAQTQSEAEYRTYLLAVIELLQQQILLLQSSNVSSEVVTTTSESDFESFLIDDYDDVVAWYKISNPSQVNQIPNTTHRQHLVRFFELVPNEYDNYFVDLLVYEGIQHGFDSFVETVPPYREDTWRIGINEDIFSFNTNSSIVEELYVHEFAHVISYDEIAGRMTPVSADCHDYFSDLGCPPTNSYLLDFIDEFWGNSVLDDFIVADDSAEIWTKHQIESNFVTEYAATDPAEDFAESFTFFVLESKPAGNSVAEQKTSYFYNFEQLIDLRSEIRQNL